MESKKSSRTKVLQRPGDTLSTLPKVGAPLGLVPTNKSPSHRPDLEGARFGSVEIISPEVMWLGKRSKRIMHVLCECVTCGNRSVVSFENLRNGHTKGCRNCNQPAAEYPAWLYARVQAMRARCMNPNNQGYSNYGGRGIKFGFSGVKDGTLWIMRNLGIPSTSSITEQSRIQLDRIDPDGHYEPGNLRWISVNMNQHNKRGNQAVARMHKFRLDHPEVRYADSTLKRMFWSGMTAEEIIEKYNQPSMKPKGKFGTFSTPDQTIASLVRGS